MAWSLENTTTLSLKPEQLNNNKKRSNSKLTSKCDWVLAKGRGSLSPKHLCDTKIHVRFSVTQGFNQALTSPRLLLSVFIP